MPEMPEDVPTLLEAAEHTPRPRRRRRRRATGWLIGAVAIVVIVVVGVPFAYFHFVEGSSPAAPTLKVGPGGTTGPVNGTWKVGGGSLAEYRVQEILFGQHHTAVGKTSKVTGQMVIKGATVVSAHFVVNMASVTSGTAGRDVMWRDSIMATADYPEAYFTLTKAVDLGSVPPAGRIVHVTATGKLTMRGKTQTVAFPLQAERDGAKIALNGSLAVHFARWGIPNPTFAVAQVGSVGDIDLLFYLNRA
jgi:polyisoprenoid-binding protein YceI